jgi:putative hydrolase of the HAD superfamily
MSIKLHPTYRNIIFDLFDVLVVTDWKVVIAQSLGNDAAMAAAVLQFFRSEGWKAYKNGLIDYSALATLLPPAIPENRFQEVLQAMPLQAQPIADMVDLLAVFRDRGYQLYLLSNVGPSTYHVFEQRFAFMQLFTGTMTSFQAKATKPDPKIYQALLEQNNLAPASCLFIDDKEANVKAGQKLGIEGIVYTDYPAFYLELAKRGLV